MALLCRISISRFYRDRAVFDQLAQVVLPILARDETELRCWSLGCASGEEAYTLNLIWRLGWQAHFSAVTCRILATDVDEHLMQRAQRGCYPASSLRELPRAWRESVFTQLGAEYCLQDEYRAGVQFQCLDISTEQPPGSFHLILCRNLILTYFEESLQRQVLEQVIRRLNNAGVLIIGRHEQLPSGTVGLSPWFPQLGIYRRSSEIES